MSRDPMDPLTILYKLSISLHHKIPCQTIEHKIEMATNVQRTSSASPAPEKHKEAIQFIEKMTRNTDKVQANVLAEILSRNADTEYLRLYNLNGATDRETFKSKIPIVTYDDLQPIIQRIADGDRSPILSAHPISEFLTRLVPDRWFI